MKRTSSSLLVVAMCCGLPSAPSLAANTALQAFVLTVCGNATGSLRARCDESQNGELSGDSEDSLNPTQSLSYNANAVADTDAKIKALVKKMKDKDTEALFAPDERSITETFRLSGTSFLLQFDGGEVTRRASANERGFDKSSYGLKVGLDHRITNDWLAGILFGYDRYEQEFDADQAGINFVPQNNEGESEADNYSLTLFTSKNYADKYYVEGLLSYIYSDYDFDRNGVFQETNRVVNTVDVNAQGDTEGQQLALSLGGGMNFYHNAAKLTLYGRFDAQKSWIDDYSEKGNSGLEMTFKDSENSEITATIGASVSNTFSLSWGILIPQVYAEWQYGLKRDKIKSKSFFNDDVNQIEFETEGDGPDLNSGFLGASVYLGLPNGWMLYAAGNTEISRARTEQYRFNAGARVEF